jgi:hypothetical protein
MLPSNDKRNLSLSDSDRLRFPLIVSFFDFFVWNGLPSSYLQENKLERMPKM